jgi:hypothetical protein
MSWIAVRPSGGEHMPQLVLRRRISPHARLGMWPRTPERLGDLLPNIIPREANITQLVVAERSESTTRSTAP